MSAQFSTMQKRGTPYLQTPSSAAGGGGGDGGVGAHVQADMKLESSAKQIQHGFPCAVKFQPCEIPRQCKSLKQIPPEERCLHCNILHGPPGPRHVALPRLCSTARVQELQVLRIRIEGWIKEHGNGLELSRQGRALATVKCNTRCPVGTSWQGWA